MSELMLCQDCLAIAPATERGHLGEDHCTCGGDWCACEGCQQYARELQQQHEQRNAQGSFDFMDSHQHEWVCHPTRGWHLTRKTEGTNHP